MLRCIRSPLLALVVLAAGAAGPVAAAGQDIGTVREVHATAYRTPPAGSRAVVALRAGVVQNERIETLTDAAVGMRFIDDTTFRVGPDSNVILDNYVFNPTSTAGQVAISLARGSMRFITGRMAKDGVRVVTPSVAIGVRGTDFAVLVHPGGVTDVLVFDGTVLMQPLQAPQATVLVAGQYARAAGPASTVQIFGLPPSSARGFIGVTEIDRRIAGLSAPPPEPFTPPPQPMIVPMPVPVQPVQPPTPQYHFGR
jgi:hypothetical protein